MAQTLNHWHTTKYLTSREDELAYFEACLEEAGDDAAFIAKARGMTRLAKDTRLGRESLYKALSGEGNRALRPF